MPTKKEVSSKKKKKASAEGSVHPNSREYFFSDNLGGGGSAEKGLESVDKNAKVSSTFEDALKIIPDWFDDGSQYLDQLDMEIANRQEKHEKEMKQIEEDIEAIKREKKMREKRFNQNEKLRNRLRTALTEKEIQRRFNSEYLREISSGTISSNRHDQFFKSEGASQQLFYRQISSPFSDEQVEWIEREIFKHWDEKQYRLYVSRVLLPESLIKIYMDYFGFTKAEAEKRIRETPLSDSEESSDDIYL